MYLVLFGFGAVLTVAGIVLAGAGLSLREGTFDASLFTPGVVAAVGGLLLIGLGMALRTLQQIERALAARAMPRVVQMPIAGAPETSEESGEPGIFAFPPQTKQARAPTAITADASDEEPAQTVGQKAPDTARIGNRSYPPLAKPVARRPMKQTTKPMRIVLAGGLMARRQREFHRACRLARAQPPQRNNRSRRGSTRCGRRTRDGPAA
jgi:hypothetical protein